ncbi:hypothetical protein N7513_002853 [Penicillium frequentans]|nr:hypothetical protein N7513_002853 [Penicillium glabrum]
MSDPTKYTVGWICALPVEYIAAQELLDEEHEKPNFVSPNDSNDYTLGKMGEHNVVIAVLPDGEYGTASAANVATNMLNSFHNVKIGLMVGIGGGVPSERHDIRLGDIVVSAPRGGEGGVFQYDFGKSVQGQSFQHTRFLNQPPTMLRTALTGIRAQYERKGHQLEETIQTLLGNNPRLRRKYKRPELSTDRLFRPEVIHSPGDCAICADDLSKLVLRHKRSEDEDNPSIHYGLVASGNGLMKDALLRDRLAVEKDVLCFEMEAAGLMNSFPCLVIRGICDYSDSHKNKEWQGYAAIVAAAYTKDLLQRIPLNKVEAEKQISVILSGKLDGTNLRLDRLHDQQEQHRCEGLNQALTDKQQRCHQVFKSPQYIRWSESNCNELLWVSADPGCGNADSEVTVCYFFFKDNNEQNDLAIALCSIIHQLFNKRPDLVHFAVQPWEKTGDALRKDVDELWQILITATSAISCQTICVFDALDECQYKHQGRLIENLQTFHQNPRSSTQNSYLKFLITSRPYDHIQHHFRTITDLFPHIHIKGEGENDKIHDEINLVVKARVRELSLPPDVHQGVEQQLLQMEHRTYLWLHLAIDDIRTTFECSVRPEQIFITLVPRSVNAAYEKILSRAPADQMEIVKKILEIIVAARRPLTIQEMAMALGMATCPEARTTKQACLDESHLDKKLRRLCGLFIFTNNSKVYLIHQTAREFLIKRQNLAYWSSLSDSEHQMGQICLRYLLMEDLEEEEDSSSQIRSLLAYSAIYWADHIRQLTLTFDQEVSNLLHNMYEMSGARFLLWFPPFLGDTFNGHAEEVRFLSSNEETDINAVDDSLTSPLTWASLNGYVKIMQILIDNGADINAQGGNHGNALQAACAYGHYSIAQMLLGIGANVDAQGGLHGNALQAACAYGHYKIAQMLLENGADVNAQGGHKGNALQAACSRGDYKIVQMLLRNGADVNSQGGVYGNALQAASCEGHGTTVLILLENGANMNARDSFYGNALQAACSNGHDQVAGMLLENGVEVNNQGGFYGNALQAACAHGRDNIAQILLEKGAEVNTQGGILGNALQAACAHGYDNITQMLLENGADVNAEGGFYGNPLQAACFQGLGKAVQMLLEKGANVNSQGGFYGNALQAACFKGHDTIVQMLLENAANVNAKGGKYGSALEAARCLDHDKIAQMLLENGAELLDNVSPPSKRLKVKG